MHLDYETCKVLYKQIEKTSGQWDARMLPRRDSISKRMDNSRRTIKISRTIYENRLWKISKSTNKIRGVKSNGKIQKNRNFN